MAIFTCYWFYMLKMLFCVVLFQDGHVQKNSQLWSDKLLKKLAKSVKERRIRSYNSKGTCSNIVQWTFSWREKKVTGVHLRKNVDTGVLLTKTNILGREKKEMNGLKGGKNIVTIPLTRTKLYNSLLSPFCCAFVLCVWYMHGRNGNAKWKSSKISQ